MAFAIANVGWFNGKGEANQKIIKIMNELTIKQFLEKYPKKQETIHPYDKVYMHYFGWFDYHCPEQQLKKRLNKMFPVIKEVVNILDLNSNKFKYYFKNIWPCLGPKFDVWGLDSIELDDNIFQIQFPALGANHRTLETRRYYKLYSVVNWYVEPLIEEQNLSFFLELVKQKKNEILLPLIMRETENNLYNKPKKQNAKKRIPKYSLYSRQPICPEPTK